MKTALVTAIGSFSADIVIRNLKKLNCRVVGCDIYPREWIANALIVHSFFQAPYASDSERYLAFIRELCLREQVRFLIPLTDVEVDVLNQERDWFSQNGVCLCLSPAQTILLCRNKYRMSRFTEKLDYIRTIPTYCSDKPESPCEPPFPLPMICKPTNGRSSQGICRIHSLPQWHAFCAVHDMRQFIVQPCIDGSVVTVDIVRQADGSRAVALPRQEMLRTLNGAGTSVYVFSDPALQAACVRLADALQIIGCVNFEFIKDGNGDYHFIECNPRFSGGVAFSCTVGYDCVRNHIAAFTGSPIDALPSYRSQYIVKKYQEYVTCIEEQEGPDHVQ